VLLALDTPDTCPTSQSLRHMKGGTGHSARHPLRLAELTRGHRLDEPPDLSCLMLRKWFHQRCAGVS
jgi:hypothetical protein